MKKKHEEPPYYGKEIYRGREQQYINSLLKKYKNVPADEDLKKKIWDELQMEKHLGRVSIPFKVVLHKDPKGKFPNYIEIILDTKV